MFENLVFSANDRAQRDGNLDVLAVFPMVVIAAARTTLLSRKPFFAHEMTQGVEVFISH